MIKVFVVAFALIIAFVQSALAAVNGGPIFSDANGNLSSQRGCLAIESYGGSPAAMPSANDTALNTAINISDSMNPGFPCVKFGVGTYRFASTFSRTVAYKGSIALLGEGSELTKLQWLSGTNGIQLTQTVYNTFAYSTFHIRNITISTEGTGGSSNSIGLYLIGYGQLNVYPTSDLTDVSLEGSDGHDGQNYWNAGIVIQGWSAINISKGHLLNGKTIPAGSVGILMTGTSSQKPSAINIERLTIGYYDVGIQYGSYTQGVTIDKTNILGCSYGVVVPSNQAGILGQLTMVSSGSNCSVAQVVISTNVDPIQITSNLFESVSGMSNSGIVLNASRYATITGNVLLGTGGSGLQVASSSSFAAQVAADNVFSGFGNAITLASGVSGWTIHDNRLGGGGCAGCTGNGNFEHDDH